MDRLTTIVKTRIKEFDSGTDAAPWYENERYVTDSGNQGYQSAWYQGYESAMREVAKYLEKEGVN
jgi:hypothetical protein